MGSWYEYQSAQDPLGSMALNTEYLNTSCYYEVVVLVTYIFTFIPSGTVCFTPTLLCQTPTPSSARLPYSRSDDYIDLLPLHSTRLEIKPPQTHHQKKRTRPPTSLTMPQKEAVSTDKAPAPLPFFSQAIKCQGMVYCSGSIGVDPATKKLVEGTVADRCVSHTLLGFKTLLYMPYLLLPPL